jgi:hypothetical protein
MQAPFISYIVVLPNIGSTFLKAAFPVKFPSINIIPTTETEMMKSVINSLKSKNSSGYD